MARRNVRLLITIGIALLALLAVGRSLVDLYTDAAWFASVGQLPVYLQRLWIAIAVRATAGVVGAILVFANLWFVARQLGPVHLRRRYGNIEIAEQVPRGLLITGITAAALLAGWWLSEVRFDTGASLGLLAWLQHVPWGVNDPVFQKDVGFYVFTLPALYACSEYLLLICVWSIMLVLLGYVLVGAVRWRDNRLEIDDAPRFHFILLSAFLVLLLALRYWLSRYALVVSGDGFGGAVGYTDINARMPARMIMVGLCVLAAIALLYGAVKRLWAPPVAGVGLLLLGALLVGQAYPALIQKLRVDPNQYEREAPYIAWHMDFTRRAYGLDQMQRVAVRYEREALPAWDEVAPLLTQLPLWDPEPLRTAFNQMQSIYGYYHFPHVDYDRYASSDGDVAQVAIAAREFFPQNVPETSRNWVTMRLNPKYTRGAGAVVSPAADGSSSGEPVLWVRNIEPVQREASAPPELELRDPRIYFGETMRDYVIVQPGSDAVPAAPNALPQGVDLSSFARLLAFAWRFGDKNLLFSGELKSDSRILFRRTVLERLNAIAPFLVWDPNPYPVIVDGHIVWMNDGYSTSMSYPLSRALDTEGLTGVRYMRNSAKATIDAVTGDVRLYVIDETDPVLGTYRRIFPRLLQSIDLMPPILRAHMRYAPLMMQAQADVLEEFHVAQPESFYAAQDVWQIPQESGSPGVPRQVRVMYSRIRLPNEPDAEFVITLPFIARQRQNMTALLIGRSDGPHYGKLVLLELPRDQQIPGPAQVQAVMEQEPSISAELSLWRQAGSDVDLGSTRVIPLDSMFLYVQPLFLSAQGSPIPELQRVIVSDGRAVAMAPTFEAAYSALAAPGARATSETPAVSGRTQPSAPAGSLPRRAFELLQEADRRLRGGDFAGFGSKWAELRKLLEDAARQTQ